MDPSDINHLPGALQERPPLPIEVVIRDKMNLANPASLQQSAAFILNNRNGSVLTRKTVLKADHFSSGRNSRLPLYVQGAPNFRYSDLNVYGVGQPTIGGIRTILSLLKAQPDISGSPIHESASENAARNKVTWISTREEPMVYINKRPFVLREADSPQVNLKSYLGISTSRLESMEERLKNDCLREAARWNGLILVHDEVETFNNETKVTPTFLAVEKMQVQTPREVFVEFIDENYSLEYYRIPVSAEQAPDDDYVDAYIDIIKRSSLDSPLVFNCGMGVGRTTFAMVLALLVRRAIIYRQNKTLKANDINEKSMETHNHPIKSQKSLLTSAIRDDFSDQYSSKSYDNNSDSNSDQLDIQNNEKTYNLKGSDSQSDLDFSYNKTDSTRVSPAVRGLFGSLLGEKSSANNSTTSLTYSNQLNANTSHLIMDEDPSLINLREHQERQRAFLRLVYVLETGLSGSNMDRNAIDLALGRGTLLTDLHSAILGHYLIISRLQSLIPRGKLSKSILDSVVNSCDSIINLREEVLIHRVKYSHTGDMASIRRSINALERYFLLVAFSGYVLDSAKSSFTMKFTSWIKSRQEVWHMLKLFRSKMQWQQLFRPIKDLSLLTSTGFDISLAPQNTNAELEDVVTKSRRGLVLTADSILKVDHWQQETQSDSQEVVNFRAVPGTNVFCVAQPSLKALENIIRRVVRESNLPYKSRDFDDRLSTKYDSYTPSDNVEHALESTSDFSSQTHKSIKRIVWINLREEPLIYINGTPYVLRDRYVTLRNLKSYAGISSSRLEVIESKLKEDILKELDYYGGRILLHNEANEGEVVGEWEPCTNEEVYTLKEIMDYATKEISYLHADDKSEITDELRNVELKYVRIPITAETPQSPSDFDDILKTVTQYFVGLEETAIIVNCQIGMGRSTAGAATVCLIQNWCANKLPYLPTEYVRPRLNYPVIHSLMRTIRDGAICKSIVDNVIDSCGYLYNIRYLIEHFRQVADTETNDPTERARYLGRASLNLRRYFLLIAFESYLRTHSFKKYGSSIVAFTEKQVRASLNSNNESVDIQNVNNSEGRTLREELNMETFGKWLSRFGEIKSMSELISKQQGHEAIIPVEHNIKPGDGVALSSEVSDVIERRDGSILAKGTILKFDIFPGAQKMTLPDIVDGAPNYRRISLKAIRSIANGLFVSGSSDSTSKGLYSPLMVNDEISAFKGNDTTGPAVYGVGMPTLAGIKRVLSKVKSDPNGSRSLIWTCLREEPVIYVNGAPYVLRLSNNPITNLEATGIATDRVEYMEEQMKRDILKELKLYNGRVLLHTEQVEELPNGGRKFVIVPIWETVAAENVQTSSDVYEQICAEGFKVEYCRIPVTDEQAPIPKVFDELINRMFLHSKGNTDILYNCQMGRGRTTTGIVITCLMEMIIGNKHLVKEYLNREKDLQRRGIDTSIDSNAPEFMESSEQRKQRFLQGEYRIVLKLVSVLQFGKLAKLLTDKVIDSVDHMQNLRAAIYDYKVQQEDLEEVLLKKLNPGSKTNAEDLHRNRGSSVSFGKSGVPLTALNMQKTGSANTNVSSTTSSSTTNPILLHSNDSKKTSISSSLPKSSSDFIFNPKPSATSSESTAKNEALATSNKQKEQHEKLLKLTIKEIKDRLSTIKALGSNYLMRYFYLIVFADYLLEEWTEWTKSRNENIDVANHIKDIRKAGLKGSKFETNIDNNLDNEIDVETEQFCNEIDEAAKIGESAISVAAANLLHTTSSNIENGFKIEAFEESEESLYSDNKEVPVLITSGDITKKLDSNNRNASWSKMIDVVNGKDNKPLSSTNSAKSSGSINKETINNKYYMPHFHNLNAVTFEDWLNERRELSTLASKGSSAFD